MTISSRSRQGTVIGLSITFNLQVMWKNWSSKTREDPRYTALLEENTDLVSEIIDLRGELTAAGLREQALQEDVARLINKLEDSKVKQHLYKEEYKLQLDKAFQDVYAMSEFLKKIESKVAPCCEACPKNITAKRKKTKRQEL